MATPFDHRGDLYLPKIHYNILRWNRTEVAGYLVGSAHGEARALSFEERHKLWEQGAQAAGERLLLAGVANDGVRETVRAIECARALGYHAAVVEPPQHPRPWVDDPRTQALYFRAVADRAKIPVVILNPGTGAAVRLSAETILSLARHPAIRGVVEESADSAVVRRLVANADDGFPVLVGRDSLVHEGLAAGAVGAVPAIANVAPFFCLSIEEAVRTRELSSAEELQQRISHAARAISQHGPAGLKHAMDLRGYYGGNPRLPLAPLGEEAKSQISEALQGINS
jgi:4-hydroxy-2-oxoglutarate aldolase